jgi:hypothetical protein
LGHNQPRACGAEHHRIVQSVSWLVTGLFEMHIRIDKNLREVKHWLQRHEQQVHLFTTHRAEEMRMYGYSEDDTYTTDRELGELR